MTQIGEWMIIITDTLQFAVPEGFVDDTQYLFESEAPKVRLSVEYGDLSDGSSSRSSQDEAGGSAAIAELLAQQREELELGLDAKIEREYGQTVAGRQATRLDFQFDTTLGRTVILPLDRQKFAKIDFLAPAEPRFAEKFDHIVERVALGRQPKEPPRELDVRRRAGELWLDMPQWLQAPGRFLLLAEGGAQRLAIAIKEDGPPARAERIAALEQRDNTNADAIEARQEEALATSIGLAQFVSYIVLSTELGEPARNATCLAEVVAPSCHMRIAGRAPAPQRQEIETAVKEVLSSIRERETR